jgi:outer membrane biosynthesis protein TonB
MSKLTKVIKNIQKTSSAIDDLDMDADTQEHLVLPLLNAAQTLLASILSMGNNLTDMESGDDEEDDDDADADEDGDEEDGDEGDDEDEEEDEEEDGEEDEDDDFAEDDDEEEEEEEEEEDEEEEEEEDEEEEEEEPAPKKKKVTKPAAKPASKPAKKPAAKPATSAKKKRGPDFDSMNLADLKAHLLGEDKKRAGAINKAIEGVGPRGRADAVRALAAKKGWI